MVKVLNIDDVNSFNPDNQQYIGRGTPYGNPFKIGIHGTRDQVCNNFERITLPNLDVEPLRGKDLVCHCSPERCHGHSIYKKLYGEEYDQNSRRAHPDA